MNTDAAEEDTVVVEDDWGLPCDFFLFAQHQARPIWTPTQNKHKHKHNQNNSKPESRHCRRCLEILCVESLTPLDMVQLGNGIHDATGHCVWTACFLWIAALPIVWPPPGYSNSSNNMNQPLRVLELGSGTGLGGLALLQHVQQYDESSPSSLTNIHVTLTDADPEALALCRRNVAHNEQFFDTTTSAVTVQALTWGQDNDVPQHGGMDVILAADVLYDIRLLPALIQTATDSAKHDDSSSSCTFFLAHVPRVCYNATTTPDAPERVDLNAYIIHQVTRCNFWRLHRMWRPLELYQHDDDDDDDNSTTTTTTMPFWQPPPNKEYLNQTSLQDMQDVGAALFVFVHA